VFFVKSIAFGSINIIIEVLFIIVVIKVFNINVLNTKDITISIINVLIIKDVVLINIVNISFVKSGISYNIIVFIVDKFINIFRSIAFITFSNYSNSYNIKRALCNIKSV
jgi:hypothetical protein